MAFYRCGQSGGSVAEIIRWAIQSTGTMTFNCNAGDLIYVVTGGGREPDGTKTGLTYIGSKSLEGGSTSIYGGKIFIYQCTSTSYSLTESTYVWEIVQVGMRATQGGYTQAIHLADIGAGASSNYIDVSQGIYTWWCEYTAGSSEASTKPTLTGDATYYETRYNSGAQVGVIVADGNARIASYPTLSAHVGKLI